MTGCSAPLPSWNDGAVKQAILTFVERTTAKDSPDFVPPPERIAVFDNDGTLWAEQPTYVQLAFAIDRVRELAPRNSDWKDQQPFKSILEGDVQAALIEGPQSVPQIIAATHAGMTTDEFERIVRAWLGKAHHPRFQRPYTDLVYQPMIELIRYLEANEFRVSIVSAGGTDFIRVWTEKTCGLPRSHVIGSTIKTRFVIRDGRPALIREPELDFLDEGSGKPVAIYKFLGRRPLAAIGNSDGDQAMLEWTTGASGVRLGMLVHHTDAEREWAYDRSSSVGYHLNAEEEPEDRDYPDPKDFPDFKARFGPRGVLKCWATDEDDPTEHPRWGRVGKQKIVDTGPLTRERMRTCDDEFVDAAIEWIREQNQQGRPGSAG